MCSSGRKLTSTHALLSPDVTGVPGPQPAGFTVLCGNPLQSYTRDPPRDVCAALLQSLGPVDLPESHGKGDLGTERTWAGGRLGEREGLNQQTSNEDLPCAPLSSCQRVCRRQVCHLWYVFVGVLFVLQARALEGELPKGRGCPLFSPLLCRQHPEECLAHSRRAITTCRLDEGKHSAKRY